MPRLGQNQTDEAKAKISQSNRGRKFTDEHRKKLSEAASRRVMSSEGRAVRSRSLLEYYRDRAVGYYVSTDGYRILTRMSSHPISFGEDCLAEHRVVLYEKIGAGSHLCHWGCGKSLEWGGRSGIQADHVDGDRLNNHPDNLVASCQSCNANRKPWLQG